MPDAEEQADVLIIGAGPAGLAVGGCLRRAGVDRFAILEQSAEVGSAWRRHYDCLHLHTNKSNSCLPGLGFQPDAPRYPSRQQVVEYFERYAQAFDLTIRFGQRAVSVAQTDGAWCVSTEDRRYVAQSLVIATGWAAIPEMPSWPGQETYRGEVLHSSRYRNGSAYRDKDVLVVGFGNSGGEIAIDLHEHGARTAIAVRGPVNVIPRDLLGIPILSIGIAMAHLPGRVADRLSAPILRMAVGDLTRFGLQKLPYGPITQIREHHRYPLLDIGTMALIREGHLRIRPGIETFTEDGVEFVDGTREPFAAVVAATGFRPDLGPFAESLGEVLADGRPPVSGRRTSLPGIYFCGFHVSSTGMLREIGIEASQIAREIQRNTKDPSPAGAAGGGG